MSIKPRRVLLGRVFLDLNTQCDFLLPRGALPVANRAAALPNIRKLMNWGRTAKVPIISSLECHRPGETTLGFPPYCIDRTRGQKKLPFTLMPRRIVLHGDNTLDVPMNPFRRFQQLIFTKRKQDFLSNPKADRLINALQADCLLAFGTILEHCVKSAVLGLLARRRRVAVVSDACGFWSVADGELALLQMQAKGAILLTTEQLLSGKMDATLDAKTPVDESDDSSLAILRADRNGRLIETGRKNGRGWAAAGRNGRGKEARTGRRTDDSSDIVLPGIPVHKVRSPGSQHKYR